MFKKCRVILLPTKEKAENCILISDKTRRAVYHGKQYFTQEYLKETWWNAHHMYIVSDDEPKEGDWFYNTLDNHIEQQIGIIGSKSIFRSKIVATSQLRLAYVPYVSVGFIEKFVEEHNKGNIISEVMVEYDENYDIKYHTPAGGPECATKINYPDTIKVNSKDNTITIRKIKTEWTREEVEDLIYRAMKEVGYTSVDSFQHFCKENL